MDEPDNPPAFPSERYTPTGYGARRHDIPGMSLRDWFAGQALTGWVSDGLPREPDRVVAQVCYEIADAMLAARSTKP